VIVIHYFIKILLLFYFFIKNFCVQQKLLMLIENIGINATI